MLGNNILSISLFKLRLQKLQNELRLKYDGPLMCEWLLYILLIYFMTKGCCYQRLYHSLMNFYSCHEVSVSRCSVRGASHCRIWACAVAGASWAWYKLHLSSSIQFTILLFKYYWNIILTITAILVFSYSSRHKLNLHAWKWAAWGVNRCLGP